MDYVTDGRYRSLGLSNLPVETRVRGGGQLLEQAHFTYDEGSTIPSGAPNLDAVGDLRGNPTTKTAYELAGPSRALATRFRYYDTGAVEEVTDPRGATTHSTYTFASCGAAPRPPTPATPP